MTTTTPNAMRRWLDAATSDEKTELARRARTKKPYLYFLAAGADAEHYREPKPQLAAAIEHAAEQMHKESKGRLPRLLRTDLVPACRACPYARKCLGRRASR